MNKGHLSDVMGHLSKVVRGIDKNVEPIGKKNGALIWTKRVSFPM